MLDGLKAEREQGITIDVAYRYFSTPRRKFIIADCPGHEQYTRNMATGASTANLAVVLIDARHGVLPQTKRHSFIASLLDIGHIVVAVNKMDLVDYSEEVFEKIRSDYEDFASRLEVRNIHFIPMSALLGDNIVEQGRQHALVHGRSSAGVPAKGPHRLGSQSHRYALSRAVGAASGHELPRVLPARWLRAFCARAAEVACFPRASAPRFDSIHTFEGTVEEAYPPMAVTVSTEDEVDISRGDMLVAPEQLPRVEPVL